jgi:hypothetical protein
MRVSHTLKLVLLAIGALATVLLAACVGASLLPARSGHWADPSVHVVDGYWIDEERSCYLQVDVWCSAEIDAAEGALGISSSDVVGATIASPPTTWVRVDGTEIPSAFGGLTMPHFVALSLRNGSRRAIEVICTFTLPDHTKPTSCYPLGGDSYRVGGSGFDQ